MNTLRIDKDPDEQPREGHPGLTPRVVDNTDDYDVEDEELTELLLCDLEEREGCASRLSQEEQDQRSRSELMEYVARLRGGAQPIRICSGVNSDGVAWHSGDHHRGQSPCVREQMSVLADRCDYLGYDALEVRLTDVFRLQCLEEWLPWVGSVVRIANIREPRSGSTTRYFACVDLHPSPTSFEGKLWVVLKTDDDRLAQVQLGARSSIGELTGLPLPPKWEGLKVGLFLGDIPFPLTSAQANSSLLSLSSEEGHRRGAAPTGRLPI